MRCPYCGFEDTKVVDSRPADGKKRRRRLCTNCGKRFTTFETVETPVQLVVKKDGSAEVFERAKLISGITTAVKKRPVSADYINRIADSVENRYAMSSASQLTSSEIGDIVLEALKEVDQVAYVRFASVYKEFDDVESFIKLISELKMN